jgi:hypothetical protein
VISKYPPETIVNITFFNQSLNSSGPYKLLHETYLTGQNLRFSSSCYFFDMGGHQKSCDKALTEEVKDVPYFFPIEFVTSSRKVVKSFTLGKLFFMFDDQQNVIVQRLPVYS